ncbi:Flp pilus assembly protein CpaB [Bacillus daqingensis]|uniref:Flp pilus assembly protein CpaB n=1 Tax=Bacillus daqingensis TaxID=872396 RepID=A0ABV9NVE2_9BACI
MMKAKRILLLAVLAGLITTGLFYMYVNEAAGSQPDPPVMTKVTAAAVDIDQYTELKEDMLTVKQVPEEDVHPEAVANPEEIIGRFAAAPIREGELVMYHRLDGEGLESDYVSKKLSSGSRAISISVDFVRSVSNLIEPEDTVDIVLSEEKEAGPIETTMLLENVRVLAVGERMVETNEEEGTEDEYHAVTFELKPEEALSVIQASERGSLQLALHSKRDQPDEEDEADDMEKEEAAEAEAAEEEAETEAFVVPVVERALVRSGPSLDEDVITAVDKDEELPYLDEEAKDEEGRTWYYVALPEEEEGWISSRIARKETD